MSHEREFLTNATPYDSISTLNPKNVLEFLYTCGHLKVGGAYISLDKTLFDFDTSFEFIFLDREAYRMDGP